jgi:hypothetical protein
MTYNNRSLFSEHRLQELLTENSRWQALQKDAESCARISKGGRN